MDFRWTSDGVVQSTEIELSGHAFVCKGYVGPGLNRQQWQRENDDGNGSKHVSSFLNVECPFHRMASDTTLRRRSLYETNQKEKDSFCIKTDIHGVDYPYDRISSSQPRSLPERDPKGA